MNVLIVLFSILVLIVSIWLFKQAAGSMSFLKLNTVSYVFYFQILLTGFFGSVIVALGFSANHWVIVKVSESTKIISWLAVMYSMIAMPIAMILLNNAFKLKPIKSFNKYLDIPISFTYSEKSVFNLVIILLVISLITLIYILSNIEDIPIITLLKTGDYYLALEQRIAAKREFQGIIYIKNLVGGFLVPMFSYIAFVFIFYYKKRIFVLLFLMHFLLNVVLLIYDIQKAPLAFYLVGFLILYTVSKGPVSKKRFLITVGIGFIAIVSVYALQSEAGLWNIITNPNSALYGRLFVGGYVGCPLSFELFPDIIEQSTWHIGIPQFILKPLGLPTEESARLLMTYINPEGVKAGQSGLISSYYIGEAWANYGLIGVILAPFIVGIVIQSLHIFLLKSKKTPFILAFYSILSIKWTLMSGFVSFLYLKVILFPLILYLLFKLFLALITANRDEYSNN